ncbi:TPA: imidazole glycerol phosphate synthase subunit HisF [Candidatus Berkelbacteria bacterium]|uniref:imidazole glycerol-phosphate synthase n=1 Tax=Berkelbacteria bacterium GW2011_GWE1_39_12 TaxID=1618337 RepID=A0A0G4B435_9BACT|nr:MAG: imidazole glycerol phosphate synthase subunit HisF [Berkelbacteria bacterium GW2011_GWE1_39_12]HBO60781.1 imidazole glycerol phosphate synthase subunit HisF [Candidatus Berkelbacteria bacterium]
MLKVRVIPTLLWKDVGLVKGIGFDSWRRVGSLLPAIRVYNTRQVDELILVDITATADNHKLDLETISEMSCECFVPFTVGGGIKKVDDIKQLLRAGADKVAINSAAYDDPTIITEGAKLFGSQCIVASIDAKKNKDGKYICYSHAGKKKRNIEVSVWAKKLEELGAGEILITSIEKDGTMDGYDINLIKAVTNVVSIPVIASGGAGSYEDLYQAISKGKASAVAAASIFHYTEQTPMEAKGYLHSKKIPVRINRIS